MQGELSHRIEHMLTVQVGVRSSKVERGFAVGSLQGPVRGDNQDRAAVAFIARPSGETFFVGLVCDGMGGMQDGGIAASCAVGTFLAHLSNTSTKPFRAQLHDATMAANDAVFARFGGSGGTTLTALVVKSNGDAMAAHVGDSRLYAVSRSTTGIELLTRDDTIGGQLRNSTQDDDRLDNRLLQFVGVGKDIEPHILPVSGVGQNTFLITSDGAHSIGRRFLEGISNNAGSPGDLVRKLTFVADAVGVEDNSSAVALYVPEFYPPPPFHSGTSITVWTAIGQLELWLATPEIRPEQSYGRDDRAPDEVKPKAKNKRQSKKTPQTDGATSAPDKANVEKPQLNISFDGPNEPKDD